MEIIDFQVIPLQSHFALPRQETEIYAFKIQRSTPDWSSRKINPNASQLTVALNAEVESQHLDLLQLESQCPSKRDKVYLSSALKPNLDLNEPDSYREFTPIHGWCNRLNERERSFIEVFSRDEDALTQDNFNVELHAIVLFLNGEYLGHIYAWNSPTDARLVFAMGIRGRVDSILRPELPKVVPFLLEGVRQYAARQDKPFIIIPFPRPVMRRLLPTFGFSRTDVPGISIGRSIAPAPFFGDIFFIRSTETPINLPSL